LSSFWTQAAEEYDWRRILPPLTPIGSSLAFTEVMEQLNYGEGAYLGVYVAGSFHLVRPLVLVALLATTFALAVWTGNPNKAAPEIQTANSTGAQSETPWVP